MKFLRWCIYALVLCSLLFVPLNRIEIANLEPVQAVWMNCDGERIQLITDTEDVGSGITVDDALLDLKQKSDGIVYLDTAEYMFVSPSAISKIPFVIPLVKCSVKLCVWDGEGDMQSVIKYADSHKLGIKLKQWDAVDILPDLTAIKR